MPFDLPPLPYATDALQPHLSRETLELHWGKHHRGYVERLNALVPGTRYEKLSLDEVVRASVAEPKVFNSAAQAWNHAFYWNGLSPRGGGGPAGALADALSAAFGDVDSFRRKFTEAAVGHFGSGWAWLVKRKDGALDVVSTHDAACPITDGHRPLLTCDVWEHAYYVDYRNARPKYVEGFWKLVNWDFVEKNLRG
jgi:Fe-Mn family superoxide dismutase